MSDSNISYLRKLALDDGFPQTSQRRSAMIEVPHFGGKKESLRATAASFPGGS